MATAPAQKTEHAAAPVAPAAAAKSRFGGKRIKIIAILAVLMVVPAVGAAFLLPKGHAASGQSAEHGEHAEDAHSAKIDNLAEVEIGTFDSSIELDDGILWYVKFRLHAMVASEASNHFTEAVQEKYKARVKQAVVKVIRMSSINDLRDPQLDLLKRNLKTEINNILPQRYIQEVVVSEIRTMQQ
jgi:flagellar basal body-associated protein FliL